MTTLIVTDLDGTLWDTTLVCKPAVRDAISALRADDDVVLLAATGRRRNSARRGYDLNDFLLPSVLLNGAVGYDFDAASIFHSVSFAAADLSFVLSTLQSHQVAPVAYLADTRALVVAGATTSVKHLDSLGDDLHWSTYDEVAASDQVLGMSMLGVDFEAIEAALRALELDERAEVAGYADHLYPPFSFMIAPPAITKVAGIEAFCRYQGLVPDRVIALGDGGNDLAMLEMADLALVVEDGDPRALALADAVIAPATHGGWASVLDYL